MTRRLMDPDRKREQRRQSLLLDRLDARFGPIFAREIARASREMLDAYEATGEVGAARGHYDGLEREFQRMAETAALTFGGRIIEQGKSAGLILERKEDFAQMMTRLALQYVAQEAVRRKITSIAETTRAQIVSLVDQGYRDGLGVAEIASGVRDRISGISQLRGALIARTETHGAANFGADVAARETGLNLRKEWVSAADERTREDHAAADGQIVGMDDAFDVGGESLMYPGDPAGSPENVINCFPPWSLIRLVGLKAAMRREYSGDLIELSFGGPVNMSVTPNHPVLTKRGWVPARFIVKGDKVFDAGIGDVGEVRPGPDIANRCARADDLYNTAKRLGCVVRPSGVVVNLHGEVPSHNVDIVSFKGELRDAFNASGSKLFGDITLADANIAKGRLLFGRMAGLREAISSNKSNSLMGLSCTASPLLGRVEGGGAGVSFRDAGQFKASFLDASSNHSPAEVDFLGDAVNCIALVKERDNIISDAIPNNFPSYMRRAFQIREVASVKSFHYSGPVYNFESNNGLLCSDGIVNHNCRCAVSHIVDD